jgi:branched-chain amino acid transport system ATP-binding protein
VIDLLYETLATLRGEGITILLVEQNAHRALAATDRCYVLRTGNIELSGATDELRGAAQFEEAYFGFETTAAPDGSGGNAVR